MRFSVRYPLIWLALGASSVLAQGVYRHVGPDGRVTFSDQPPANAAPAAPVTAGPSAGTGTELPFALRQTAQRYPVTLYSTDACAPCDRGRELLRTRGIPFTEKSVNTAQDQLAFQKIASGGQVPYLTIGGQGFAGFSAPQWTQYLDAAGYPKTSALPRNYRFAEPAALVPLPKPEPTATPSPTSPEPAPPAAPTAPSGPTPQNPAGIRF